MSAQFLRSVSGVAKGQTLADQIEQIGRALTAKELSRILSVSTITIFKQAKAGRAASGSLLRMREQKLVEFH